jgi:hypothetical protein
MRDPKYRTVVLKRNRAMQMAAARQHFALVVERAGRFPTKAAAYVAGDRNGYQRCMRQNAQLRAELAALRARMSA